MGKVESNPPVWRVEEIYKSPTGVIIKIAMANYPFGVAPWPKVGDHIELVPKNAD